MKSISSRDNPFARHLRALAHSARERRAANRTVLDGAHLIRAAIDAGWPLEAIAVSDQGLEHEEIATLLARLATVPATRLSDALFAHVSPVDSPSGVLAILAPPTCPDPADFTRSAVVLDGVQDPGNLGTLLRTAAAAGIHDILLTPACAQAWSPRVLRAGMGGHFRLRIHEQANVPGLLGGYGGEVIATALGDDAVELYEVDLCCPVVWLFGAEGSGLSAKVSALATRRVTIPMPGAVESLNVAAAAAVCLFEQVRQFRRRGSADAHC